jgi:phosphohistidine phosphatase SixA
MKRLKLPVILGLLTCLITQSAYADDLAVWDKAAASNAKGYVLLLRHALAPGSGDPANFRLDDCSTQRNLSDEGRQDARDIGLWLKSKQVKIYRVESSRWCRAKETAELLGLASVRLNKNLDSLFREVNPAKHSQTALVKKQIVNHRKQEGLLVMVGHFVNIGAIVGAGVDSGEGILVRANSKGEIKIVGKSPKP